MKISGHRRHPKNVMTAPKAIPQQEFQKVSNSSSIVGPSA
jgi:hypothetical protein